MSLAVDSPVGKAHDARGRQMAREWAALNGLTFIETDPAEPAAFDGVLVKDGLIVGLLETRTRATHSYEDLQRLGGTFLVTNQKLDELSEAARLLRAPLTMIAELACGRRFFWVVFGKNGRALFDYAVRRTVTQATSLGPETATRDNAYLPFAAAAEWHR